ncbi:PaaI family thioesterase [Glycomyces albidus]|jgi:acyl-coenzyme A thioesterase PaaI-like protein|uniref:Acyl-coenzyme A thioesterase THEM4 n=1 Tax=Glycomyces albidus TaxID=2656774 RepID=A0A6L5GBK1_9ACTN|nr:PaaI family thioesterase [Glycomyces albidus]MQM27008.1 PaaI family thioesterase [Glycomyces albidus]
MSSEDLELRREAVAGLGRELRALMETVARTETPTEVLQELAGEVKRLEARFTGHRRERSEIPSVDVFPFGLRMYSPATGHGSAFAPPLEIEEREDGYIGRCVLGVAHEGPPGYAHGGMSALLLDELMGWACAAKGLPAMTIALDVRYQRPVPVELPLLLRAEVTGIEGRKITVDGTVAPESDPDAVLVAAQGRFVAPDLERARSLFPGAKNYQA